MFARTTRLTLRPGWPEDAPALAAAIGHEAVATRLAHVPWPYTVDDAAAFLAMPRAPVDPTFLIWSHDSSIPRLVGGIAIAREGEDHELSYWLTSDAWGRGYATEAARAVVAIARDALPIDRLVASPHADNLASARVLRKLGFVETGRARRHSRARGGQVDSIRYALDLDEDRPAMPLAA